MTVTATLCAYLMFVAGCGTSPTAPPSATKTADHDHDHEHEHGNEAHEHHLETYALALAELTSLRDTTRDAFAKNDLDAAHEPLHEVGHVLDEIPKLAEKEGISGEALGNLKAAVKTLFDAFGDVDKTMHGQDGSKYSDVSAKIDDAVKVLTDLAPKPQAAGEAAAAPASDAAPAVAPGAATAPEPGK